VLFGLFSVKLVNIPMFLTFRRCSVLATIVVDFIALGNKPNASLVYSSTLLIVGAIIAGWETLSVDAFGYMIIWCNNFA
jgi:hypothetical protein